jgi:putative transcriptional regulator
MSRYDLKQGILLIAEPFMQDGYFKKSVLALCDYSKNEGSVGFILNKPTNLTMPEVMQEFPEFDSIIYYGGPVANDTIHYIHKLGDLIEGSREIVPGLYWGGDFKKIKILIEKEVIKPKDIRFYIGYAGWAAGQLEDEMDIKSWVTDDINIAFPFLNDTKDLWHNCMHNINDNLSVLADLADTVSFN